jgi:homoprotocatechuate degradation regulator HpaR
LAYLVTGLWMNLSSKIDTLFKQHAMTHVRQSKAELRSFHRSLPMALLRAREVVMNHFRRHLREHDVTEQQWRVLRALHTGGAMNASDVSSATLISMPSLSRILKTLSDRELLLRAVSDDDLRSIIISLSPQGVEFMSITTPESERIYLKITSQFGEQNLEALYALLESLETSLD